MTSDTLSYQDDEISSILSKVTLTSDFLQTPSSEFKARDLERESRKLLSFELHSVTMAEYLKVKRIPRGLRIRTRPTFFKDNRDYCSKFEQILNKCSFDIMTLTLSFLQQAILDTKELIKSTEEQLQAILSQEDYDKLLEKLRSHLATQRKEIEDTKRNKFRRDTEDYRLSRVYRWPDTPSSNSRWRSSSTDSSNSGSNRDPSYRSRQMDARPPRTQRRPNRGTYPQGQQPTTITTRSQAH
ncbi:uncharacterized protein LOC122937743 [Bufo gargarizans]|uniref:uncharacterized protein LOC122937743 n=1 Tax=Bufo gargarizans TaxID=30331 RepID=UPI001CF127C8|nr:uncharacterized protein LOC122937743 [Bufo gargarizans]